MFSRILFITAGGWRGGGEERCDIVNLQRESTENEELDEEGSTYGSIGQEKKTSFMASFTRSARDEVMVLELPPCLRNSLSKSRTYPRIA
jgi:hypothetical protein